MFKDDLTRLRHMIDAAKEAVELASGKTNRDIENERVLNLSLDYCYKRMNYCKGILKAGTQTR